MQGYARDLNGQLRFAFDTSLGTKPTDTESRDGKSWVTFQKKFHQLLVTLFRDQTQTTLVALNSIGYVVLGMTHSEYKWDGQAEFTSRVKRGQPFSPAELLQATENFHAVRTATT